MKKNFLRYFPINITNVKVYEVECINVYYSQKPMKRNVSKLRRKLYKVPNSYIVALSNKVDWIKFPNIFQSSIGLNEVYLT